MKKFCTNCGTPLDANGRCPKCNFVDASEKKQSAKKRERKVMSQSSIAFRKRAKIIFATVLILLFLYTVALVTLGVLTYMNKVNIPVFNDIFMAMGIKEEKPVNTPKSPKEKENTKQQEDQEEEIDMNDSYEVPAIDADDFYDKNSTVESTLNAKDSQSTLTESEVCDLFEERGFYYLDIKTSYDMDGNYSKEKSVSSYSSNEHPMYSTQYISPTGVVWTIYCTNGDIMAIPLNNDSEVMLVLSETGMITSYDNITNKFFVNTPNADIATIKKVEVIDSQTLDEFTME